MTRCDERWRPFGGRSTKLGMAATIPDSLEHLRVFIHGDAGLLRVHAWLQQRCQADPAHDVAHAERVALWTLRLAPEVTWREAVVAGLLHDVVNVPKDSPDRARASEYSAAEARRLLPGAGFNAAAVERICNAIRTHSYSRGETPGDPLGAALQDADRLEALGALGLCRTLSTGAKLGAEYFDAQDPWATGRQLDDLSYTVDHFFTKLLPLADTLLTVRGRAEARTRAAFLAAFLVQLGHELGVPAPLPGPSDALGETAPARAAAPARAPNPG